jgi:hypothetical protein
MNILDKGLKSQNEYLGGTTYSLRFFQFYEENCAYKINGEKLTINWKLPRKTTTYKRIKQ